MAKAEILKTITEMIRDTNGAMNHCKTIPTNPPHLKEGKPLGLVHSGL